MKFVVVMPFNSAFDAIYATIKSSVEAAYSSDDLICLRVDEDIRAGHITGRIVDHIRSADVCIADITHYNANVMWEVGYIEALQKPLIALSQSVVDLPFNIHDLLVISYAPSALDATLRQPLIRSIQQTLTGLAGRRTKRTIAITGSRSVMPYKAKFAVQAYTSPFLSPETTWYCGTNGPVDEAAATVLIEAGQRVTGIHSSTYGVSPEVRATFAQHGMPLLDADLVTLPLRIPDLSWRDAFFVSQADLLILIWDGESQNTQFLHEWLTAHNKDHLLAFA